MLDALMAGTLMVGTLGGQAMPPGGWFSTIAAVPAELLPSRSSLVSQSLPMLGQDAISHPPVMRHRASETGTYHLILTLGQDESGHQRTTASLFKTMGDRCQQIWSHPLPHSYGPRLALVNDAGTVLLLDEWINVASPRAIVVIGLDGEVKTQHSFDDIVAVTGQSRAEVVEQAAQGFWLAGNPVITPDGSQVAIPAAGGQLTLDLTTGDLGF